MRKVNFDNYHRNRKTYQIIILIRKSVTTEIFQEVKLDF